MDAITDLLTTFGVAWPKLVAQVVTFLIVYLVLKKYAFGPVTAMLEQRREHVREIEANLEKTRAELEGAEASARDIVRSANDDAERLVAEAKDSAVVVGEKQAAAARVEAEGIVAKAQQAAARERDDMMAGLKSEFGRLVAGATTAVTGKVLTDKDQDVINKDASTHLN